MGFLWQEYWSGLPLPSPVDHVLSELSTVTHPSWVALHGISHSFIELHKPFCHDKAVIYEGVTMNRNCKSTGLPSAASQEIRTVIFQKDGQVPRTGLCSGVRLMPGGGQSSRSLMTPAEGVRLGDLSWGSR